MARENLPGWNRLWDDLTQEELRVNGGQSVENNVEDHALFGKGKREVPRTIVRFVALYAVKRVTLPEFVLRRPKRVRRRRRLLQPQQRLRPVLRSSSRNFPWSPWFLAPTILIPREAAYG